AASVTRCSYSVLLAARPPRCTLFPYTTLFRSRRRSGYAFMQQRLGYPLEGQDYLAGFVLLAEDADSYWRRIDAALDEAAARQVRSEEHTSELQSRENLVCRLLLEKKNKKLADG